MKLHSMPTRLTVATLIVALISIAGSKVAQTSAGEIAPSRSPGTQTEVSATYEYSINELSWISGDWQTAAGGRALIEEHWTQPGGGSMMGMSRAIAGNKTAEFEYL